MEVVELKLTMTPDGNVQVTGPIVNKPICLYMLESAKRAIMDYKVKENPILLARGSLNGLTPGPNGGK